MIKTNFLRSKNMKKVKSESYRMGFFRRFGQILAKSEGFLLKIHEEIPKKKDNERSESYLLEFCYDLKKGVRNEEGKD